MEINFCRRCGARVTQSTPGVYRCKNGHNLFYDASPAGICLLLNSSNQVLMVVRSREPGKGTLDLPGGFLDLGETFEEAIQRELKEEIGLSPADYTELIFLCDAVDSYDYQGETKVGLPAVFTARVKNDDLLLTPGDDVGEAKWMSAATIDFKNIYPGFNAVRKAVRIMQQRLG